MTDEDGASETTTVRMWLRTVAFWLYMALSNPVLWLVAVLIWLCTAAFDPRRRILHLFTCAWAYHYVKLFRLWAPRFSGLDNIRGGQTYVLVANHQSLGDILLLFGLFKHFKWVSKREIFRVPFIGWNMRMNDYVGLVRGDAASIERMMNDCRRHLHQGSSVMMFPEGTRSEDGEIKSFKHGAFSLAKELTLPVVPIVIDGTRDALPKHGLMLRQRAVLAMRVHVLPPVFPEAGRDAKELSEIVRGQMVAELQRMRKQAR